MCPGLLCCALAVTPTLQHGLKTELSTPKTLQHLQPHPLVLPFACEKPGKEVSPFPAANLCGELHSWNPVFCLYENLRMSADALGRTGAPIPKHDTERGDIVRGDLQSAADPGMAL